MDSTRDADSIRKGSGIAQPSIHRRITPVPVAAVSDPRIYDSALRTLIVVSANEIDDGWCDLTQQDIGEKQYPARHRTTISRILRHLADFGYLQIRRNTYDLATHAKHRIQYRVLTPPNGDA